MPTRDATAATVETGAAPSRSRSGAGVSSPGGLSGYVSLAGMACAAMGRAAEVTAVAPSTAAASARNGPGRRNANRHRTRAARRPCTRWVTAVANNAQSSQALACNSAVRNPVVRG